MSEHDETDNEEFAVVGLPALLREVADEFDGIAEDETIESLRLAADRVIELIEAATIAGTMIEQITGQRLRLLDDAILNMTPRSDSA